MAATGGEGGPGASGGTGGGAGADGGGWIVVDDPVTVKPSLRAAFDLPVKLAGTAAAFLLPVLVQTGMEGGRVALAAVLSAAVLVQFLPAIAVVFWPAIQLAFTRYRLDDDGLRVQTQIFSRSEKRVAWDKVTALRHGRGVIDRLLGIERLDVIAYGERGTVLRLVGLRGGDGARLRDIVAGRMRREATVESLFRND